MSRLFGSSLWAPDDADSLALSPALSRTGTERGNAASLAQQRTPAAARAHKREEPTPSDRCLALRRAESELLAQQARIALLGRCAIPHFEDVSRGVAQGLVRASGGGSWELPRMPRPRPDAQLEEVVLRGAAIELLLQQVGGVVASLLLERWQELALELQLWRTAAAGGRSAAARELAVMHCARRRYLLGPAELEGADACAEQWLEEASAVAGQKTLDTEKRRSLAGQLFELARTEGLDVPVVEADLSSLAAVSQGRLLVRRGVSASSREAARVWVHEVHGHLLPRLAAVRRPPPFRVGTRESNEDEEGRALLLEERAGLLGRERRRDLALRHVLARAVLDETRTDEEVAQVATTLVRRGAPPLLVAQALCRSLRGGGLAREVVYLPAWLRVRSHLARAPDDERWMQAGCISLCAIPALRAAEHLQPE